MTYFLSDQETPPVIPANNPDIDLPDWSDGVAASFGMMQMDTDANFRYGREVTWAKTNLASDIADRVGLDAVVQRVQESGRGYDHIRTVPEDLEQAFKYDDTVDTILEIAREQAEADPEAWSDVDLTEEGIEGQVNESLKAERSNLELTLAMMNEGQTSAALIGGLTGAVLDAKTLPFMFLGSGAGSFGRLLATEALINAGAELATMPSQFKMADRLDIENPDVLQQTAIAAVGGAGLAGLVVGGGRALEYLTGRSRTPAMPGRTDIEVRQLVDQAEDIIANSDDPIRDLMALAEENPANKINPAREPLVLKDPIDPNMGRDPEDPGAIPDAPIDPEAIRDQMFQEASDLFDADFPEMRFKKPLAEFIIARGGVKYKRLNKATGEMELTPVAQELAHAGVTPKTYPRLFRKDGRETLDNLVASEAEGLNEIIRIADDGLYLDAEDLTTTLAREVATGEKTPMSGEIQYRMDQIDQIGKSPLSDFLGGQRSDEPDGLFFSFDDVEKALGEGMTPERVREYARMEVDEWLMRRGYIDEVLPEEREEIIEALIEHGGDAEYLLERMWERELGYAARPADEVPDYAEIDPTPTQDAVRRQAPDGRPDQDAQPATGSRTGGPDDRSPSEATDAGDQLLVDGVAPITQRDRLEAAQDAPMRGGNRAADDGLFDVSGRSQGDMFDDVTSPEARAVQDAVEADLRADIEKGETFEVDMGDGKGTRPVGDVLDEINAAEDFSEILDLCGRPK